MTKIVRDDTQQKEAEEEREALLEALQRERAELERLNETLEERIAERTRQVRELASTLTMAEQAERRRVSRILHDDLQQQLYGIGLKMAFVRRAVEAARREEALAHLDEAERWIGQGVRATRNLTADLSPPILQNEGLADALRWLRSRMKELHELDVDVQAEKAFRTPEEDMRVLLFQIVRELLFNVAKHAGTKRATVELRDVDNHVEIVVADDGDGFDVEAAEARAAGEEQFGLFSVRERLGLFGGQMEIDSKPGAGTRVRIHMPLRLA